MSICSVLGHYLDVCLDAWLSFYRRGLHHTVWKSNFHFCWLHFLFGFSLFTNSVCPLFIYSMCVSHRHADFDVLSPESWYSELCSLCSSNFILCAQLLRFPERSTVTQGSEKDSTLFTSRSLIRKKFCYTPLFSCGRDFKVEDYFGNGDVIYPVWKPKIRQKSVLVFQ